MTSGYHEQLFGTPPNGRVHRLRSALRVGPAITIDSIVRMQIPRKTNILAQGWDVGKSESTQNEPNWR